MTVGAPQLWKRANFFQTSSTDSLLSIDPFLIMFILAVGVGVFMFFIPLKFDGYTFLSILIYWCGCVSLMCFISVVQS